MDERGHLGKKYDAESHEPSSDLWGRIEAGMPRKKPRRRLLWWWGIGGSLLIISSWWTMALLEPQQTLPNQVTFSQNQEITPPKAEKGKLHSAQAPPQGSETHKPEANEARGKGHIVPVNPVPTNQETIDNIGKQSEKTTKPAYKKLKRSKRTLISQVSQARIFQESKVGGEAENSTRKHKKVNASSTRKGDLTHLKAPILKDNDAARMKDMPQIEPVAIFDNGERKQESSDKIADATAPLLLKSEVTDSPNTHSTLSQEGPEVVEKEVPTNQSSALPPSFESNLPKPDSLVNQTIDTLHQVAGKDSITTDSSKAKRPSKWHMGLNAGIYYVSKTTTLNQSPESKRVSLANQNSFGADRLAFTAQISAVYQISTRAGFYGSLGVLYMQDQSEYKVRGDSIVDYAERVDASGNRFVRPVYQENTATSQSKNLFVTGQAGVVFSRLAGPFGLRLGGGMSALLWEDRKITPASVLDPGSKNMPWAPSFHVGLPVSFGLLPAKSLIIEPECTYFIAPVFKPGKGTDTRPTLLGLKLGFTW